MTLPLSPSAPASPCLRLRLPSRADRRRPRTGRARRRGGAAPGRHPAADPQRELRLRGRAGGHRHRPAEQVQRGVRGPSLLRRPAEHRPRRDAGRRARQGRLRRRARQRPALLRLARQPRRLSRLRRPRRHGAGHVAADGRPPHARLGRLGDRQVVPRRAVRRPRRHRPHRLRRGARPRPQGTPEDHLLWRYGRAAHHRLRRLRRDRPRGRRGPRRRHRAHRRADRRRRPPLARPARRRHLHHHPQDAARPPRRDADVPRHACQGRRQGRLPRPPGRPAQPHHRRHRGRPARGRPHPPSGTTRTPSSPTPRRSPRRCWPAASTWSPAVRTTTWC